jgi:hypothetical protein
MGKAINRRTLLALSAAGLVGGCSQLVVQVLFTTESITAKPFSDAIRIFTQRYGYRERSRANGVVQYEGLRTRFYLGPWPQTPWKFVATFRPKDDWWLIGWHADLFSIADAFKLAIGSVDGVSVKEGYW